MNNYQSDLILAAPVASIYKALATENGIRSWWTATCNMGTAIGEQSTFMFVPFSKFVVQIENLQLDTEVRWHVVEHHLQVPDVALSRSSEWVGTTILFRLSPQTPLTTRLQFEHIGLTPELECHDICTQGWEQYLSSLKLYIETGSGAPYVESAT